MKKSILVGLAAYFLLLAAGLVIAPAEFYRSVPGVSSTGPFNDHFARDIGFAFFVSATGLFLGARRSDRTLVVLGAAFPSLHAAFHVASWGHHASPYSATVLFDIAANTIPAAVALAFAQRLKEVPA